VRRIYVSLPADPWLPDNLNRLKWGIVEEIEKLGYTPEIFTNPCGKPGLASARSWHPRDADEIARRCTGAAVLGMPRWRFTDSQGKEVLLPTEFNHYEGALFHTLRLPTLVLTQREVLPRVVFDTSFGGYVGEFEAESDVTWLHTDKFRVPFDYWVTLLKERRDVFLGYSRLAEAYDGMGQATEGIPVLIEALTTAHNTGERFWEAEIHRRKGELLLALSAEQHAEAEACLHQALDIARRQQAKSLELHAAMSLSRLWQQQGKREEAYTLLAPVYGWFTEGFDTADLREAKALLATLS
jgi:tetratricopeptide (TPR) repeat protein